MEEDGSRLSTGNPEREKRILDAVGQLLMRYGYDKTTVSDIAREAGISKGAIYLHFESKETLVEELIFRESELLMEEMLRRIEEDEQPMTLFSIFRHAIEALLENAVMRAIATQNKRVLGDFIRRMRGSPFMVQQTVFRTEFVRDLQTANIIRGDFSEVEIGYFLAVIRYGLLTIDDVIPGANAPPLSRIGILVSDVLQRGLTPEDGGDSVAARRVIHQYVDVMKAGFEQYRHYRKQHKKQ